MNRRTIYRWLAAYHYGGEAGLQAKAIVGAPMKLSAKHNEQAIQNHSREEPLATQV